MSKKALKNLAALQPKEVPKKGDKKAMGAPNKPKGKDAPKKATPKPAVETKDEIVEWTSRSKEIVQRKVCTSSREICRQGLFQDIMKMKWFYKRRYGAKFRKAIFEATVEFPAFKKKNDRSHGRLFNFVKQIEPICPSRISRTPLPLECHSRSSWLWPFTNAIALP